METADPWEGASERADAVRDSAADFVTMAARLIAEIKCEAAALRDGGANEVNPRIIALANDFVRIEAVINGAAEAVIGLRTEISKRI